MSPQQLPQQEPRIETGAIQFGDDWPGLFIRGDEAIIILPALRASGDPELARLADIIDRDVRRDA
jgi:hypothetical protein